MSALTLQMSHVATGGGLTQPVVFQNVQVVGGVSYAPMAKSSPVTMRLLAGNLQANVSSWSKCSTLEELSKLRDAAYENTFADASVEVLGLDEDEVPVHKKQKIAGKVQMQLQIVATDVDGSQYILGVLFTNKHAPLSVELSVENLLFLQRKCKQNMQVEQRPTKAASAAVTGVFWWEAKRGFRVIYTLDSKVKQHLVKLLPDETQEQGKSRATEFFAANHEPAHVE